jgi:methyl-accepting chemotaxis protein
LQDIRARDSTISEIADKLHETAEAAETAASAARSIDEERRNLSSKVERMKWNHEKEVQLCFLKVINTY